MITRFVCLALAVTSFAHADWIRLGNNHVFVEREDGYRPRCLSGKNGQNIFFWWKEHHRYRRVIKVRKAKEECENWRSVHYYLTGWEEFSLKQEQIFGTQISASLRFVLRQIRFGASLIRSEASASEYLDRYPIETFTLSKNIWLTQRFGHGFAGEVYREWVLRQENNQEAIEIFKNEMKQTIREIDDGTQTVRLAERSQGVAALVIMGLAWSYDISEDPRSWVRNFVFGIQNQGIEVVMGNNAPLGTIEENAKQLESQVYDILASGRDLLLFSLCKGTPEGLSAIASILDRYRDEKGNLPKDFGRFRGMVNISGMVGGTFYGGAIGAIPNFVKYLMSRFPHKGVRWWSKMFRSVSSTSRTLVKARMKEALSKIPKTIPIVNLTGVLGEDGFPKKDPTGMDFYLQLNQKFLLATGANDGFILYPETVIPPEQFPHSYVIPINGSHMIVDGSFLGHSLDTPTMQKASYTALMHTMFELEQRIN